MTIARKMLLLVCIAIVALLIPAVTVTVAQDGSLPDHAELLWDVWGVPHIFSPDNEGMFYAFGWAQAQNHGDLLLRMYGEARGTAAAYWGEEYLDGDELTQTLGIPQEATAGYEALSDEWKGYVDAFAQGINDYVAANPDAIGTDWQAVLPVEGVDVIANGVRTLRYLFVGGQGLLTAQEWESPNEDTTSEAEAFSEMGSNAWAIAPSHSASGSAMLLANPHQPWEGIGMLTEAHIVGPDYDFYGSTLVGSPVLSIGFNDDLGWTHTVNTHDGWDVYELTLTPDGSGYVYDGEERAFETREVTLQVKQDDGSLRDVPLTVQSSVHGPVIAHRDAEGKALALRVVPADGIEAAIEWWEMGHATSLAEFEVALSDIRIPMFTVMYADREGNIMHVFNELVPIRSEGDWAFWNNTTALDSSNPAIIPGDSSEYLWTAYHPYADLPRTLNPDSGWLQNSNEPPWTTTLPPPLNPDDYPPYMLPPSFILPRTASSLRLLSSDDSITYDELVTYKFDTRMALADFVLDDLIAAGRDSDSEIVQQAIEILEAWDRHANADSVGAVLFAAWANAFVTVDQLAVQWDINDPLHTPHGLADPEGAVVALEDVATQLEQLRPLLGVGMDIPYGDVFRLRIGDYDLPANGAEDLLGTFSTVTTEQDTDRRFRSVKGDSFIAIIEFSDPIHAEVLLTHGNASQPDSPHLGDQLELFARREMRPVWRTREEIEANLAERVVFDQ